MMDTNILNMDDAILGEDLFIDDIKYKSNMDPVMLIINRLSDSTPPHHIYSDSLRIDKGSRMVQDTFEAYLGDGAYQSSHLKKAMVTPLHFAFSKDDDAVKLEALKDGDHFELGTFIHQCILEPTRFGRVVVEPKYNLSTKDGVINAIRWWHTQTGNDGAGPPEEGLKIDELRQYLKALKGISDLITVPEDVYLKIQILKKHLDHYADGIVFRLLKHCKREISFYSDIDGIPIKVRPDAIQFEENIGLNAIISIKSTACEDLRSFYSYCASYHYDLTEALYQDVVSKVTGREFRTTIMIMLQTVEPYAIAVLIWNNDDISVGRYKYRHAMESIKECAASGVYPGYEVKADNEMGLICMQLPVWNGRELLPENQLQ